MGSWKTGIRSAVGLLLLGLVVFLVGLSLVSLIPAFYISVTCLAVAFVLFSDSQAPLFLRWLSSHSALAAAAAALGLMPLWYHFAPSQVDSEFFSVSAQAISVLFLATIVDLRPGEKNNGALDVILLSFLLLGGECLALFAVAVGEIPDPPESYYVLVVTAITVGFLGVTFSALGRLGLAGRARG